MSEASDDDERERIRAQKKEELLSGESSEAAGGTADSPAEPVHVDSESHLDELVADGVVLVDFYADWCGPCKMLEPIVANLAETTDATVAKVDVDAHQPLAQKYQVQGVPTMFLFADGEAVERFVGVQDEESLRDLIEQHA